MINHCSILVNKTFFCGIFIILNFLKLSHCYMFHEILCIFKLELVSFPFIVILVIGIEIGYKLFTKHDYFSNTFLIHKMVRIKLISF